MQHHFKVLLRANPIDTGMSTSLTRTKHRSLLNSALCVHTFKSFLEALAEAQLGLDPLLGLGVLG